MMIIVVAILTVLVTVITVLVITVAVIITVIVTAMIVAVMITVIVIVTIVVVIITVIVTATIVVVIITVIVTATIVVVIIIVVVTVITVGVMTVVMTVVNVVVILVVIVLLTNKSESECIMIFYIDNENEGLKIEKYMFRRSNVRKENALLSLINIDILSFFKFLHGKDWNNINLFKIEFDDGTTSSINFTRLKYINIDDSNLNTINLILII